MLETEQAYLTEMCTCSNPRWRHEDVFTSRGHGGIPNGVCQKFTWDSKTGPYAVVDLSSSAWDAVERSLTPEQDESDDGPPWCFCGHNAESHDTDGPSPFCDGCATEESGDGVEIADPFHAYQAATDATGRDLPSE